jgi:hypothetical protein
MVLKKGDIRDFVSSYSPSVQGTGAGHLLIQYEPGVQSRHIELLLGAYVPAKQSFLNPLLQKDPAVQSKQRDAALLPEAAVYVASGHNVGATLA